jgi:hypothetical protein
MKEDEIEMLVYLIETGISNYQSVYDRTGKSVWLDKVNRLNRIKNKVIKLEEGVIKSDLIRLMTVNLEIETVDDYGKRNQYIINKEDVVIDFLEEINQ